MKPPKGQSVFAGIATFSFECGNVFFHHLRGPGSTFPHAGVRLQFGSRSSVSVSREGGGRREAKGGWVGGRSVRARLCLGMERLGLLLTLLPSNQRAVSPQRRGGDDVRRDQREHVC